MPEWPSDEDFKPKIKILRSKAAGRQFDCNFKLDIRLSESATADFIKAVREANDDFDDIRHRLTEVAQKYVNEGELVALSETKVLGRAVPIEDFALLIKEEGVSPSIYIAKQEIKDYAQKKSLDEIKTWLNDCCLSRKVSGKRLIMWATFDPECSDDPFAGMIKNPVMIRAQLGMSKEDETTALILLYYKLPSGITPRYPTTAHAYAGEIWAACWRPADQNDRWGWTQPWDSYPDLATRPEIVHDTISAVQLYVSLEIVD